MRPITFASLNIRGCRVSLCRCQVLFLQSGMGEGTLIFLQEIHTDLATEASWQLKWEDRVYFSYPNMLLGRGTTLFSQTYGPKCWGLPRSCWDACCTSRFLWKG